MNQNLAFYINGTWVNPEGPETLSVLNPATEEILATLVPAQENEVDQAVQAANSAFSDWSQTSSQERLSLLEKLLIGYQDNYSEMAKLISQEMGAPIDFAFNEQADCGKGHITATIEALKQFDWEEKVGQTKILKEPIGVCALITPWNWPINQIACKVAPALATGCTMVLKPSELTPLSAQLFAQLVDEAGFPPGVFNLIQGTGPVAGSLLSQHPKVDMVSFTGSTKAGVSVSEKAAQTIKRVTLELGGKSPCLVFEDADLAQAVQNTVTHCMENSGQSCNAPTRLLVQESVYEQATLIALEAIKKVKLGKPHDKGNHIGPLVSATQFERVQQHIQQGISEGAKLVFGGLGKPLGFEQGYYCRPTLFTEVNNAMRIAQEEIFGPVLCIIPFKDEAHGLAIANDTPYGLAAYLYSANQTRCERVAKRLRAGMVRVNGASHPYAAPFGGYKQSGNGRECGRYGMEEYLEIKALSMQ